MTTSTRVQIFNQSYSIGGELQEEYLQQLAVFVDAKMQTISDMTGIVDTQKVAIFAALAIADELHRIKKESGKHEELLKEQAERCLTLVERALKQTD